jgi:hypothetical protein
MEATSSARDDKRRFGTSTCNARKTHCKHGHPLSGPNLRISSVGYRFCGACIIAGQAKARKTNSAFMATVGTY